MDKEEQDKISKFLITNINSKNSPFYKDIFSIISNGKIASNFFFGELGEFLKVNKDIIIISNDKKNILKLDLAVRNKQGVKDIYFNILKHLDILKEKRKNIEIYIEKEYINLKGINQKGNDFSKNLKNEKEKIINLNEAFIDILYDLK